MKLFASPTMSESTQNVRGSILRTILIIVAIVLVISYFGFDLKGIVESPQSRKNFSYVTTEISTIYHKYLERPVNYLWHDIFLKLIWSSAVENLQNIKDGKPTTIQNQGPSLPAAPRVN